MVRSASTRCRGYGGYERSKPITAVPPAEDSRSEALEPDADRSGSRTSCPRQAARPPVLERAARAGPWKAGGGAPRRHHRRGHGAPARNASIKPWPLVRTTSVSVRQESSIRFLLRWLVSVAFACRKRVLAR